MTCRKQPPKDLTGIRQRGSTYQVRISSVYDPVTGRQLFLSGSADTEDATIVLRDPALGDMPISRLCRLGPRPFEQLYAELRACRRRCHGQHSKRLHVRLGRAVSAKWRVRVRDA